MTKLRHTLKPFGYRTDITVDNAALLAELRGAGLFDTYWTAASMKHDNPENLFVKANSVCKENFDGGSDEFYTEVNLAQPQFASNELSDADKERHDSMLYRLKRVRPGTKEYSEHADVIGPYSMPAELAALPELSRVLSAFKGKVGRVRIARLGAGGRINPHIDYDPSYVFRYHIPLITNKRAYVCAQTKGHPVEQYTHFREDGCVYWLNTGIKHWVVNQGDQARYHLLFDVDGATEQENMNNIAFFGWV